MRQPRELRSAKEAGMGGRQAIRSAKAERRRGAGEPDHQGWQMATSGGGREVCEEG